MFAIERWIPVEEEKLFTKFSLGFMVYISLWAILHDQIVIRIEPRHFTEYHRPLLNLSNPTLLAIQYGFIATFGLGIVFGMITYFVTQYGRLVRIPLKKVFMQFVGLSLLIESICLTLGYLQYLHYRNERTHLFYPESIFPDQTLGIAITQTINVSAYLFAGLGSFLFWLYLFRYRKKAGLRETSN